MNNKNTSDVINSALPDEHIGNQSTGSSQTDAVQYIKKFLHKELPPSEERTLDGDLLWTLVLDKHRDKHRMKQQQRRKKKNFLTRKERTKLNLLKLPKTGWNYGSLQPMRDMWKQYMRENLDLFTKLPKCTDPESNAFNAVLMKSEFVGAELLVVRSKVPSLVDLNGTVVLETKMSFQIVTKQSKLKIILKEHSVFVIVLDNIRFTIFGKHLLTRPSERSVKKIKLQMLPDLL